MPAKMVHFAFRTLLSTPSPSFLPSWPGNETIYTQSTRTYAISLTYPYGAPPRSTLSGPPTKCQQLNKVTLSPDFGAVSMYM